MERCGQYVNGGTCLLERAHDGEHEFTYPPQPKRHEVVTEHISRLIDNAALLAREVNRLPAGSLISVPMSVNIHGQASVEDALHAAAADLSHAADELLAEAKACRGWVQR